MSIFGSGKPTCSVCGAAVKPGINFCPACGAALSGGRVKCGSCGRQVPADSQFCPHCGQGVSTSAPPKVDKANRWRKGDEDFATRIEVTDLHGLFRRHLIIEPGTRAIILVDGANHGTLPPGKYTFDDIGKNLKAMINLNTSKVLTAILIDDGPCEMQFDVPSLFTTDPLRIGFTCQVVVQLDPAEDAPFRFINAMLKSRRALTLADMRQYLYPEIRDVAQAFIGQQSVKDLNTSLQLKREMEQDIEMALNRTFERSGLIFDALRTLNFAHEEYDEVGRIREKYFLEVSKAEADLAGGKLLFEVRNEAELQAIAEETAKIEHYERRIELWARMRQAVLSDRMDEVRTEDEFEAFMREQDKARLIRDEEYEDLKRTFAEETEDHELQRRYLVRKIEMERQMELDRMQLEGELELLELRLKRREVELRAQLNEERIQALERKQIEVEGRQKELGIALQEAKTQAEIEAIQREQDKLDGELGVYMLELMDARKNKKERQEMLLEAEREENALGRRLREEAQRHQQEMERLLLLSQGSVEFLISVSGSEQAGLLAELKRTETLSGMSEEQILALAAEHSPEVAKAFQEKFQALSAEKQTEMYERMLKDKEGAAEQLTEALREASRMQQETAFKAMETQRDISVAYAQSGGQTPVIVTPGAGTGVVAGPGEIGGRVTVCPRCHTESPVGVKYCQNCGFEFFEK